MGSFQITVVVTVELMAAVQSPGRTKAENDELPEANSV